jgi:AcrR family transcriptional regulator
MTVPARDYGGLPASERVAERRERLLAAGLQLLGTAGVGGLTVRGVIEESGLAPRYFYESFDNVEELQVAVFNRVAGEVEVVAREAILTAPRNARARIHAVITGVVHLLTEDSRKGRIILVASLGSPRLAPLRTEQVNRFAALLAVQSRNVWRDRAADSHAVVTTSHFAVGGFAEILAAVLEGRITVDVSVLVEDLTELFLGTGVAFRRMSSDPLSPSF